MFTIIGGDGREYGPVSVEQVRLWLAAGRANLATQAKRIGEDAWRPLGEFAEFSVSASHEPPPLEEPEVMTGPIDAKAYANALIARAAPLDPFDPIDAGVGRDADRQQQARRREAVGFGPLRHP